MRELNGENHTRAVLIGLLVGGAAGALYVWRQGDIEDELPGATPFRVGAQVGAIVATTFAVQPWIPVRALSMTGPNATLHPLNAAISAGIFGYASAHARLCTWPAPPRAHPGVPL